MSARKKIVEAFVAELKKIDGTGIYTTNVFNNVFSKHKFWDEVPDFPTLCVVGGQEQREYLSGGFKWGHYGISIKVYVKNEDPAELLEALISDIELALDNSTTLTYGVLPGQQTAEVRVTSIVTDEGLLVPYGIGEVNISVQYQVLN